MRSVSFRLQITALVLSASGCSSSATVLRADGGNGPDASVTFDAGSVTDGGGGVDASTIADSGTGTDAMAPNDAGHVPRCRGMLGAPGTNTRMYSTPDDLSPRKVVVHIPEDLDPNRAVPILFAMHGATMNGEKMHAVTGFDAIADREGFVVVYPSGTPGLAPWNVGTSGGVCGAGALVNGSGNDIVFVERMLADIARDQCIDRDAVFVTGFSMGGYFSNHIGCQAGDYLVRGIAPHSGGTYAQGTCPGAPLPALIMHGSADPLIAASCGQKATDAWVARNRCASTFEVIPVLGGECRRYDGCPTDAPVMHCVFEGMAHGWAGAPTDSDVGFYAGGAQYESASELVWSFFAEQLR
jgi:polyhydroxybutyrate depolymerase